MLLPSCAWNFARVGVPHTGNAMCARQLLNSAHTTRSGYRCQVRRVEMQQNCASISSNLTRRRDTVISQCLNTESRAGVRKYSRGETSLAVQANLHEPRLHLGKQASSRNCNGRDFVFARCSACALRFGATLVLASFLHDNS